jgi:hypothetical protein
MLTLMGTTGSKFLIDEKTPRSLILIRRYETENKIIAEESGKLHNVGTDAETMRAKGFFQYTGPDNVVYTVQYTADENGFIPVGDHLPTPPPIPAELAKALERAGNKL